MGRILPIFNLFFQFSNDSVSLGQHHAQEVAHALDRTVDGWYRHSQSIHRAFRTRYMLPSEASSPHCTIHAYEFRQNVTDYKARLMIDLAVPRDIEPVVGEIEGVELHDIDFIKNISEENNRKKSEQREHMYEILEGVYQDVKHEMAFNSMLDRHKDVLGSDPSLQKEVYKMKAGNSLESIEKYIVSRGE